MALEANVGVGEELFVEMVDVEPTVKVPRELLERLIQAIKSDSLGPTEQVLDIVKVLEKL